MNPGFYKIYELDAQLPDEWRLELRIMNKGLMGKNLIGSFALDLEDRILGEKYLRQRLALEINLAYKQMR